MPMLKSARYQVRVESLKKCQQAIREFVDYIKANEPGTLRYIALQQADDLTRFLHFMMFQDAARRNPARRIGRRQALHRCALSRDVGSRRVHLLRNRGINVRLITNGTNRRMTRILWFRPTKAKGYS